mmetsp:Transcript_46992/g.75526  ORF Transcript_46992/g.75526 Transcript_46992/m.75526 type:complete len:207 (+) Transcript_46992:1164-1784(+)
MIHAPLLLGFLDFSPGSFVRAHSEKRRRSFVCPFRSSCCCYVTVQKLQRIFNHLNVAFSGKVCLGRVYRILRKSKELLQYIGDISRLNLSEEEETTAVSFIDMLEHLFKYTHHHQLAQIISWANIAPTPMLDEQRLRDIQEMFKKCDEDGGGTISLEEFKESLVNSGIARSEAIRRFKDINSDGDAEITSLAFVKFYSESLSLNVG